MQRSATGLPRRRVRSRRRLSPSRAPAPGCASGQAEHASRLRWRNLRTDAERLFMTNIQSGLKHPGARRGSIRVETPQEDHMRLVVLVSGIAAAIGLAGAAVAQNAPADGARFAQATGGSMSGGAAAGGSGTAGREEGRSSGGAGIRAGGAAERSGEGSRSGADVRAGSERRNVEGRVSRSRTTVTTRHGGADVGVYRTRRSVTSYEDRSPSVTVVRKGKRVVRKRGRVYAASPYRQRTTIVRRSQPDVMVRRSRTTTRTIDSPSVSTSTRVRGDSAVVNSRSSTTTRTRSTTGESRTGVSGRAGTSTSTTGSGGTSMGGGSGERSGGGEWSGGGSSPGAGSSTR
ncbi:MAG: hypothetical protein HZA68_11700 [Rhodovulum sp.]|nr:hypothetical protein [Rhodovulum sp.]